MLAGREVISVVWKSSCFCLCSDMITEGSGFCLDQSCRVALLVLVFYEIGFVYADQERAKPVPGCQALLPSFSKGIQDLKLYRLQHLGINLTRRGV